MSGPSKRKILPIPEPAEPEPKAFESSSEGKTIDDPLTPGGLVIVAGAPGSGKSNVVRWATISSIYKFSYGLTICPTAEDGGYSWFDERLVQTTYSEAMIADLMDKQAKNVSNNLVLIADDCMGSIAWQSRVIQKLVACRRKLRICVILVAQYINVLPPFIRECASDVFIFKQITKNSLIAVHESFLMEKFPDSRQAIPWFQGAVKEPYSCLYYKKAAPEQDRYRVIMAPDMTKDKRKIKFQLYVRQ